MGVISRIVGGLLFSVLVAPAFGASDIVGSGTDFFINSDGWLITNAHVVESCSRVTVADRGETSEWKIDVQNDLAAVHSPGATPTVLSLRTPPARLGEDIAALGYPLSDLLSSSIKITTGNVNSLLGLGDDTRYLQISAPLQPGNSGGPLVDRAGAVLGVNSAVLKAGATHDSEATPQNVNFAIRGSVVELFLQSRSIKYTPAPTIEAAMATADLAEKVAPAVVSIVCHGKPSTVAEVAAPIRPAVVRPDRSFLNYPDQDVIGFDYRTMSNVSRADCLTACQADDKCRAITYNKAAKFCFLKNDALLTVWNKDATASVLSEAAGSVLPTGFRIQSGRDQIGGDYLHLHNVSFVGCFAYCVKDDECRSFAYVRKKHGCWLKNGLSGSTFKAAGVDLGTK